MNGTESSMVQNTGVQNIQKRAKKMVKGLESESWGAAEGAGVSPRLEKGDTGETLSFSTTTERRLQMRLVCSPR